MKVYIEFPAGEVRVYEIGKKNPLLDGYTVKNIERRALDNVVRIISKNEDGCEKTQYFCGAPYIASADE